MKTHALLGFILILAGLMAFVYQGITCATGEKAVELHLMHMMTAERTLPLPPLAGALALAGGIALLVTGDKKEPRKESQCKYGRWLL